MHKNLLLCLLNRIHFIIFGFDSTRLDLWLIAKINYFSHYSSIVVVYMPLRKKLSYVYTNINTTDIQTDTKLISPKTIAFQFMLMQWKK